MAEISAALVKELRAKSGAGMMDCKRALTETAGDLEVAVDWLRKKGLAAAAKKAGRVAAEGLVGLALGEGAGAMVEVNSETDFVARNPQFQDMVRAIARVALGRGPDLAAINAAPMPGGKGTVAETIAQAIATIGENMTLRRASVLKAEPGQVAGYLHNSPGEGVGKMGVLVALRAQGKRDEVAAIGKQLAMHVAAANPQAASVKDLDPAMVARERAVLSEQAQGSGKSPDIVAKMVEGRLRKYYQEVVLLEQTFVIDGETQVQKAIAAAAERAGAPIEVAGFARFAVGEGIEKPAGDFAAEVAKMTS
jgi:elongation factor Ts